MRPKHAIRGHYPSHAEAFAQWLQSRGGWDKQAGDSGGESPTGAPSRVAQLDYSDPLGFNILTQDILLQKLLYFLYPFAEILHITNLAVTSWLVSR